MHTSTQLFSTTCVQFSRQWQNLYSKTVSAQIHSVAPWGRLLHADVEVEVLELEVWREKLNKTTELFLSVWAFTCNQWKRNLECSQTLTLPLSAAWISIGGGHLSGLMLTESITRQSMLSWPKPQCLRRHSNWTSPQTFWRSVQAGTDVHQSLQRIHVFCCPLLVCMLVLTSHTLFHFGVV